MKKDCENCKHCPVDWRTTSQLPLCGHPDAPKSLYDTPCWTLYSKNGHCGTKLTKFEARNEVVQEK